jgi:hypothetical protein
MVFPGAPSDANGLQVDILLARNSSAQDRREMAVQHVLFVVMANRNAVVVLELKDKLLGSERSLRMKQFGIGVAVFQESDARAQPGHCVLQ